MESLINFQNEWFRDEVRDGFYVDGLMKCFWAAGLEIFKEVEKVCNRHGLKIFADCGTLLGAVRHRGMIPWDDDLDFAMFRDDYIAFRKYASEELPEGYLIADYHELDNDMLITWVSNGNSIHIDKEWMGKYHDFPYPVGIDIFPLDFISPNSEEENARKIISKAVYDSGSAEKDENASPEDLAEVISTVEELTGIKIDSKRSIRVQMYEITEQLYSLYGREGAEEVALMHYWTKDGSHKYDIHLFDEIISIPFEDTDIPVPARYDEVLKIEYGDYMRIVRGAAGHDYPIYSSYEKQLEKMQDNGRLPYKYYYDKDIELERNISELKKEKRREVVFIPFMASTWDGLEEAWQKENEDENTDVYVMPVPWFDRCVLGDIKEVHYERDLFPLKLNIVDHEEFNLAERHPDIIYFQNPYDFYNYTVSVDPNYFSDRLKKYCNKLIFIPYLISDDISDGDECAIKSLEHFVRKPGIINADIIILPSENMRKNYIEEMVRFAGEESRSVWENKTQVNEKLSAKIREVKYDTQDKWESLIGDKGKKVIFYYISLSSFLKGEFQMVKKLKKVISIFEENKEKIVLILHPDTMIEKVLPKARPNLWEAYVQIVDFYKRSGIGIFDDSGDSSYAVFIADAYYGEPGPEVENFRHSGKPVMIEDCSIL